MPSLRRGGIGHLNYRRSAPLKRADPGRFRGLVSSAFRHSGDRRHLYGTTVTLADVCLVPQLYNARRFRCDLAAFPTLTAIGAALEALPAFAAARPEAQPDAD